MCGWCGRVEDVVERVPDAGSLEESEGGERKLKEKLER